MDSDSSNKDNPALSQVIERNIRMELELRAKVMRERSLQEHIADVITAFSGRMEFVVAPQKSVVIGTTFR